jgi:ABC-type transport system involved in multi-copper enzyme maturation permease subunit
MRGKTGVNSYCELVKFEYRKILLKRSTIITLLLAVFLTAFSCVGTLMGYYYIKGEVLESNYDGMKKDREYIRSLSGREIGSDILSETVEAYSRIPPTDGKYTDTQEYQQYARPYSEIYYMIRKAYNINDWKEIALLTEEKVDNFYSMRQNMVERSVEDTTMNSIEKAASVNLSRHVKTPFIYSYTGGYTRFFSQMYTTAILICFICSICIAPLFAGEYTDKMDSLILSSKYGKNKIIYAKLFTGLSFSMLLSIVLTVVSYITVMVFYGWEGGSSPIQLFFPLSIRPLTMGKVAFIYFVLVLLGNMLSATLTMFLSAKLKSPFTVIVIMTVVTVLPMFVNVSEDILWIYHLSNLIPVNMFYLDNIIGIFSIDLFGLILQPYEVILIFAIIGSMALMPFAYRGFKNHN